MKTYFTFFLFFCLCLFEAGEAATMLLYSPGKVVNRKKNAPISKSETPANTSSSSSSTVDPVIMSKIEADFENALNGGVIPELGDTMNWGGGTLTRTKKGELRYVNTNNGYYTASLKSAMDIPKLARENGDVNNTWIAQYGVNLAATGDQNQQEAYKKSISHVATNGLQVLYNKENPWKFSNGIEAYNENGKTVFTLNGKVVEMNELQNSNQYKALTGAHISHEVKGKESNLDNSKGVSNSTVASNVDYIKEATNSSIDMLIKSSKLYKAGSITKDQFIEIDLQVSNMADYNKKVGSEFKNDKPAPGQTASTTASDSSKEKGQVEKSFNYSSSQQEICNQNPQFAICRPPSERLAYLKEQIDKIQKPMSLNFMNSFGPGFDGSEQIFAEWTNTSKEFVVSCDEALNYGLFSSEKGKTGAWKISSNRKFYDTSGNFVGEGGAYIRVTQYVDKSGNPMVEPNIFYPAVGYCQK